MKTKLYLTLIMLFIFGCEDTEDAGLETTVVGSWNMRGLVIQGDCDGDGQEEINGTAVITETNLDLTYGSDLADWCDNPLTDDNLCIEDGDTTTLSMYETMCTQDSSVFNSTTGECESTILYTYTISDSLYLTMSEEEDDMGTGLNLEYGVNTFTLSRSDTYDDLLVCTKWILTK